MRALRSGRLLTGSGIVLFFVLVAVIGPFLAGNPNAFSKAEWQPPSGAHWLGTTQLGQDVLSQVVHGAGATLEIGAGAGLLATVISIVIGIGGGYAGGLVDEALSLLSNVVLVIPALPLIIVIASFVRATGVWPMVLVIAFVSWAASARVLRAQTLSVRNREYVLAAKASGDSAWRIIFFEILPNELPIIVSQFIFSMIFAILTQAGLAFLGLASPDQLTWGTILYFAQNDGAMSSGAWWWFVPPGLAVALMGTGLVLLNTGIDEFGNPRLRDATASSRISGRRIRPTAPTPVLADLAAGGGRVQAFLHSFSRSSLVDQGTGINQNGGQS
jgi:peptide/nickel transport system permease protein